MKYSFDAKNHIHTLDGKPLIGTSTCTKIVAKPLTWWAAGMAVEKFGWVNPKKNSPESVKTALFDGYSKVMGLSIEKYGELLSEAYRAHNDVKNKKAEEGTDMHALLEQFVRNAIANPAWKTAFYEGPTPLAQFARWAQANVNRFLWSELNCFSKWHWIGGISDLGIEMNDGKWLVGDFKSSKEAYMDQFWQCGLYDLQISAHGGYTPDGKKVFRMPKGKKFDGYVVFPFGAEKLEPKFVWDVKGIRKASRQVIGLYKQSQKFAN